MKQPIPSQSVARLTKDIHFKPFLKTLAWIVIIAAALFYIYQNAIRYFALDPAIYKHHWSHASLLLLHITGGIFALLLGPFQFWLGVQRQHMLLHRWIGRLYLISVGASTVAASYILLLPESLFGFRLGIAGLALAWGVTSGLAYIAIRKGQIEQHKEWMIRSYVVTFGFVFFRILLESMNAIELGTVPDRVSAVSWLCWALPLFITEIILQGRKIFSRKIGRSNAVRTVSAKSQLGNV